MHGPDNIAFVLICSNFVIQLVNKVVVGEARRFCSENLVHDVVQILLDHFDMRAHVEDLVAPALLAEEVRAHGVEGWRAVVVDDARAEIWCVFQRSKLANLHCKLLDTVLEWLGVDHSVDACKSCSTRSTVP